MQAILHRSFKKMYIIILYSAVTVPAMALLYEARNL